MTRALLTACLLLAALTGVAREYDRDSALALSQAAIGTRLDDYRLRDTHGRVFELAGLRGRPLVVSMVYTSCHHVCPMVTRNLAHAVDIARDALGEDAFSVVTIGFDWKTDSPERMRQFAVQQGADGISDWYFLAADATSIDALSDNLGFLFFPSPKGFDHLVQTTIVDRSGTIYRQLYGVDIDTRTLVEPLKELVFDTPRSAGLIEHWVSTFKLFCTVYDPNSERYRFDYSIFTTIVVGLLCLGAIATFIVYEWRSAR
ncbi:MAG TPA: SCO family protein [Woeseiaceae bacterium]|nr:SCO family protein [Woeseiaceae bacterium]